MSYAWSKFSGRALIATLGLYVRTATGDEAVSAQAFPGQVGRTGSVAFTVSLSPDVHPLGRTFVAVGGLTDSRTGQPVAGSSASSTELFSSCG